MMTVMGKRTETGGCNTGKVRYDTEAAALAALVRVRGYRLEHPDGKDAETHFYVCRVCEGWHLSSNPVAGHGSDFMPEHSLRTGETWENYAHRLERRIKEQRAQLLSLQALGHGASNRDSRRRIQSLVVALGAMTERWEAEVRNREALVERIRVMRGRDLVRAQRAIATLRRLTR